MDYSVHSSMTPSDAASGFTPNVPSAILPKELARLLELAPDGIVVTNVRSGRIVFANPSFAELAGRSVEELLRMRIWELHPEDMDRPRGAIFEEVVSKGTSGSSAQPILRPDGSVCPIEFRAWTANWQGQRLTVSIVRDISKRAELQQESELRAEHSKALLELVRDLEQAEGLAQVMDAVHARVEKYLGFNHSTLCRYPANDTHCTRLAIRSSDPTLSSLEDGASFRIKGDELMEEIVAGADTQIVPVARLDSRIDRAGVDSLGLQSIVRVATGLSSGTRIVLEFVTLGEEGVRIPSDIHLEFARGLVAHAGAVVERLELARSATRSSAAIAGLLEAVGSYTDQEFFDVLAVNLGKALGVRHVMIAEPCSNEASRVRSIAFLADGGLTETFEYPSEKTPCALVMRDGFYSIQDGVQEAFPEDKYLVEFESRAFLGISMLDADGVLLGHLALLHDKPFEDIILVEKVARLFAARGAAELKRAKARQELERSLDAQRKVNELLQISGLPIGLHTKLSRSIAVVLGGKGPSGMSGGVFLMSDEAETFHCEAWISEGGVDEQPPVLDDLECPHRLAVASLEPQFLPGKKCEDCDNFNGESGVILPLQTGGKAVGTFAVFGEHHAINRSHAEVLRSAAGALAILIESHRAHEALQTSEERLRQSQKLEAIGGLAGGIAHDFNNLMTAVLGNAELLLADIPKGQEAHERALEIQSAGRSAARLTSQLLAFTRRQVLERRVVDVCHLVKESTEMLRRLVPEDIEVDVRIPEGELLVHADAGQVQQVVMNLVVNARDAMPSGGKLVIKLGTHAKGEGEMFAALCICDTGTGMSAATIERAFEPFFTTKEAGKGTGLGLSVVYGIVSQHGGWIDVESELDRGANFHIYLPLLPEGTAIAENTSGALTAGSKTSRRSMVVEDEEAVRRVTRLMLEQTGHSVISAAGGEEALELFDSSEDLDVVLLDVVMPGMSGVEVFREIRKRKPEQTVLFVTGHDPTERLRDFEGSPGVGLLRKPYTCQDLTRKLDELLAESAESTSKS